MRGLHYRAFGPNLSLHELCNCMQPCRIARLPNMRLLGRLKANLISSGLDRMAVPSKRTNSLGTVLRESLETVFVCSLIAAAQSVGLASFFLVRIRSEPVSGVANVIKGKQPQLRQSTWSASGRRQLPAPSSCTAACQPAPLPVAVSCRTGRSIASGSRSPDRPCQEAGLHLPGQ